MGRALKICAVASRWHLMSWLAHGKGLTHKSCACVLWSVVQLVLCTASML